MPPPQQRFRPDCLPNAVDLRLIVQFELLVLQSAAQVGFERRTRIDVRLHGRIEKAHRAAALRLGLMER